MEKWNGLDGYLENTYLAVIFYFRAKHCKLWTLTFLRRIGMDQWNLMKVYYTVILSLVEYCTDVYDSLVPKYLSDKLEAVQKQAMKIKLCSAGKLIEDGVVNTLKSSRREACE